MRMPRRLSLFVVLAVVACSSGDRPADTTVTARDTTSAASSDGVAVASPADSGCAGGLLTDSSAGSVQLGNRVESIRARCPGARDSTGTQEGMPTSSLVVPVGADTIAVSIVEGRAWRLAVLTRGLRTADSLGIGTSLTRLLQLPGARAITGEGRTFVVAERPCGLSFELDRFVQAAEPDTAMLRTLARQGAVARRVLVTGCAGAP